MALSAFALGGRLSSVGARLSAGFLTGREQRRLDGHSSLAPRAVVLQLQPNLSAPSGDLLRPAFMLKQRLRAYDLISTSGTLVVVLDLISGPSAVLRGVASLVIDAVKAMPFTRPTPHVGQEVLIPAPAVAYGYAAPSVILEPTMAAIGAATQHSGPCSIFRSFFAVASFTMSKVASFSGLAHHLSSQAAARFASVGAEANSHRYVRIATVALALPKGASLVGNNNSAFDSQAPKLHSSQIKQSRHANLLG
jgi:hypothetical protein